MKKKTNTHTHTHKYTGVCMIFLSSVIFITRTYNYVSRVCDVVQESSIIQHYAYGQHNFPFYG
jgi:hypothetical protein